MLYIIRVTDVLAATNTDNLNITASVVGICTLSASSVTFGDYNHTTGNLDATGTVFATCSNGLSYSIELDEGDGASATTALRKMFDGGSSNLHYTLYQDSDRTTVWGTGDDKKNFTGTGSQQNHTVYGRIHSEQVPTAGSHTDTVLVTVTF